MRKLQFWLTASLLFFIAAAIRTWNLGLEAPDYEEVVTALTVRHSVMEYFRAPRLDLCPPLYYFFLKPFSWIGSSANVLRVFSMLVGAATVAVLFAGLRQLFQGRTAAGAALLLLLHPVHISFSQEAQPEALAALLIVLLFFQFLRAGETNELRGWIFYDLIAVALLHSHRLGLFVLAAFLLAHLARVFTEAPNTARKITRARLLLTILYNHVIIAAVALPWLFHMPSKPPWEAPEPAPVDLAALLGIRLFFGLEQPARLWLFAAAALLFLLLLPPMIRTFRERHNRPLFTLLLVLLIPTVSFTYSLAGRSRFSDERDAIFIVPLFCAWVGWLLSLCNLYVRITLLLVLMLLFGTISVRDIRRRDKIPYYEITQTISRSASPTDIVAFWPDFTLPLGKYYIKDGPQSATAEDVLEDWAEVPENAAVYFVISHYYSDSVHYYTFPGALQQFATAETLWRQGVNFVTRATKLDRANLSAWYEDPETLNIVDSSTTNTQFIFTPEHQVFQSEQFHAEIPVLLYDPDGRRVAWTNSRKADMDLRVMLSPGSYLLKMHCSPLLLQPEFRAPQTRSVAIELWTGQQRKKQRLDAETTIELPFSTDAEVTTLPVHLDVSPLMKIRTPKTKKIGLKIYSLAIDQVTAPDEESAR